MKNTVNIIPPPPPRANLSKLSLFFITITLTLTTLTFTACPAEPPASDNTPEINPADFKYTLKSLQFDDSTSFTTAFGGTAPVSGSARILTGSKATLEPKFAAATSDRIQTGLTYSDLGTNLDAVISASSMTDSNKTNILNALKKSDATGFATFVSSKYAATGIFRE